MRKSIKILVLLTMLSYAKISFAWVYPEHRQIAILAIQQLKPEFRATLNKIWAEARLGYTERLTSSVIDMEQGRNPTQLDYASWPAIAGDHSCSPQNMLQNVLKTKWILQVADVAAQLKIDLAEAKTSSKHINAIRNSDIRLQKYDPEYATRASTNNVHFLLARPEVNADVRAYLNSCLQEGKDLNAIGAYAKYHVSALNKAARYAREQLTAEERSVLILAAMADEAFAIHFLEDAFASGHIAGIWGNASTRKGTHDYYNEKGLELSTWNGKRAILKGDAYMTKSDAEQASDCIRMSLEQLLKVIAGDIQYPIELREGISETTPDSFNICTNTVMPLVRYEEKILAEILMNTPVPGLATGAGELPRFRSELGLFFGISPSLIGTSVIGGFGKQQTDHGLVGGLEANMRLGFGLDGVLNNSGDGLVFVQFGWRTDASSTNQFLNADGTFPSTSFTAAIPGRSAINVRVRMPFCLIPGDLLFAGPILYLVSPKTFTQMAVKAGNGGMIPWQSGIATPIGRFQFVLGREMGVYFYGLGSPKDVLLINTSPTQSSLIEFKSTKFEFPIVEFRTLRNFSQNQSSSLMMQFSAGFDIPHHLNVLSPVAGKVPELKTVWHVSTKVMFNWRHYF